MADTKPKSDAGGFSDFERAAMKERATELKAEEKREKSRATGEKAIHEKIDEMPKADRDLAERFHALVTRVAPDLDPKTYYGMPAYARDGKVLCFFQAAQKFESRYASIGFQDNAALDDGPMWPVGYAVVEWTDAVEKQLGALIAKAAG